MTIVATPGAANANSYETLVEAQAYMDNRLNVDAWTNGSTSQEEALLQACQILEQLDYLGLSYQDTPNEDGYLHTTPQALKWPRVLDDTGALIRNYAVNVVPSPIKNAQSEIALWLLQTGGSGVSVSAAGIKSMKIGNSVEIQYETGTTTSAVVDTSIDPTGLPIQAARFLKGLRLYALIG
jgi:Putative DnaT-like ssDNA binding protein